MALTAPLIEVHPNGSDTNGGFFQPSGPTFPTDLKSINSLGTTSAPVVSSASYDFVAGDVGHWVFIKSGTNWIPGWYQITAVNTGVSPHTATLDATIGHAVLFSNTNSAGMSQGLSVATGCVTSSYVNGTASGTWGVDYSQTDQYAFTTATGFTNDATNTHLIHASIGKNWVGNSVNIATAGTGFTLQRVVVLSTSGTTATCDKTLGGTNLSGGGGQMGGALATPGLAGSLIATNGGIYIQNGAYSVTSATANVAGGCISTTTTTQVICGFGTRRWDMGTAPVLTASGISTFTMFLSTGNFAAWNVTVDCASLTSSRGFDVAGGGLYYVTAKNCTNKGIVGNMTFYKCRATGCATTAPAIQPASLNNLIGCVSHGNSVNGFGASIDANFHYCIAYSNSGTSDGFSFSGRNVVAVNCTAYGNGQHGFSVGGTSKIFGCISEGNTGWGFQTSTTSGVMSFIDYCATYNNGSGGINDAVGFMFVQLGHNKTYTSTAFKNATGGDFSLNYDTNGGGMLRGQGLPSSFPRGTSTSFMDIGAVQTDGPSLFIG